MNEIELKRKWLEQEVAILKLVETVGKLREEIEEIKRNNQKRRRVK